jgi:uncharacterized protein
LDPIIDSATESALQCAGCSGILQPDEKFCGYCGHEVAHEQQVVNQDAFTVIQPTLIYYFLTLLLLAIYKLTDIFPDGIEGLIIISIVDVTVVIAFWGYFFGDLMPLFSLRSIHWKPLLLTIGGAFAGALVVSKLADLINISLFDDIYYSPYLYEDTAQPLLWAIIMTCVQPAIFEEVAFRGFMFSNLQVLSSPKGAIYVSAVLFGIMHLSFIALIWLIPLGIAAAMLRMRYNTLWYGIIGHFVYNFTVTAIDFNW